MELDGYPEITGMCLSKLNPGVLLLTEDGDHPVCLRIMIGEIFDEKDEEKVDEY